jgi:hypothetical protein
VGYFKDADEVYAILGGLFRDVSEDAELSQRFKQADTILRYEYTDPEAVITLRLKAGEPGDVDCGESDLEPEVTMAMTADTAHLFWLGQVNVSVAMARGQIKARGPVQKILRLVPAAKPVFAVYKQLLEDRGRADLADV